MFYSLPRSITVRTTLFTPPIPTKRIDAPSTSAPLQVRISIVPQVVRSSGSVGWKRFYYTHVVWTATRWYASPVYIYIYTLFIYIKPVASTYSFLSRFFSSFFFIPILLCFVRLHATAAAPTLQQRGDGQSYGVY